MTFMNDLTVILLIWLDMLIGGLPSKRTNHSVVVCQELRCDEKLVVMKEDIENDGKLVSSDSS